MQDQLKVALIQPNTVWEKRKQNRENISSKIADIQQDFHLLVLPETFSTGFSMKPETVAETMSGKTVEWMQTIASERNCALVGSLIIEENKTYYNRLLFVHPSGEIQHYDKRHLFTLAGEDKVFSAGTERLIVDYLGWKICPLVCYDLRFPVWSRNTQGIDMLIYVANWPKPRIIAWDTLLKARAIENMCYCIGVNRVGEDYGQNEYTGSSAVYDVLGNSITSMKLGREQVEITTLEKSHIAYYRNKLGFLDDRDNFNLVV
ncbi:MAG: nitrilase family protein [Mangrovimonas sp.]|nr:nitrilase family protein [Mangrovimonas sp.]MCB0431771.1 nitrilase family protein [Mangrovimonas sp.]HRV54466.1 nitrilase family protein [Mangrovimonas sp.]